jgi:hypothetical protein
MAYVVALGTDVLFLPTTARSAARRCSTCGGPPLAQPVRMNDSTLTLLLQLLDYDARLQEDVQRERSETLGPGARLLLERARREAEVN